MRVDRRHETDERHEATGRPWIIAGVIVVVVIAAVIAAFFLFGGDADVDIDPGEVTPPTVDVDVNPPDVDVESPDVSVDPGDVEVEDAPDADADAEGG